MKCNTIKEKIDLLVFEENTALETEIIHHTESCPSCQNYFAQSAELGRIRSLMQKEPELSHPDAFTTSIMSQIDELEESQHSNNNSAKVYQFVRKALSAASILLLMVFGMEQYMFVDKISQMEENIHLSSTDQSKINNYQIINYNLGFKPESINKIMSRDLMNPDHQNLKTKIMHTRLTSMAINKLDRQQISQVMQELSRRNRSRSD